MNLFSCGDRLFRKLPATEKKKPPIKDGQGYSSSTTTAVP